jgi:hypothetical protein
MKQYDVEVLEIRPFTRQVHADSPEEAIAQTKAFYGNRIAISGEPVVRRVCSLKWHAQIQDALEDGWEDDETQYKFLRDETLGPFDTKEEARVAALKACVSWPVAFEEGYHTGQLRWYQELERGYRQVEVVARPDKQLETPVPAEKPALEPEFAN